ncbi:putative 50S ribosomal subunit protein L18 [Candidatus Hodgkinia cicadicola Dsem]|nr:putative 50S ribosomal subunit protein L18 [Candidatus Hodgkinia cicadicola Dsem]
MARRSRLRLHVWRSHARWYAQVIDDELREVIAAAHSTTRNRSQLARSLAARCLAAGVFELQFDGRYAGGRAHVVNGLRALGLSL